MTFGKAMPSVRTQAQTFATNASFWTPDMSANGLPRCGSRTGGLSSMPSLERANPAGALRRPCGQLAPHAVEAVHDRRQAIAECGGLRFRRRRVVRQPQKLDRPAHRVEDRELGELVLPLPLGIDGSGIHQVQAVFIEFDSSHGRKVENGFVLNGVNLLFMAVAEEAKPRVREITAQEFGVL